MVQMTFWTAQCDKKQFLFLHYDGSFLKLRTQ